MKRVLPLFVLAMLAFTGPVFAQGSGSTDTSSKTTTEKPKRGPVFSPTKAQILEAQTILKGKGLYNGEASGKYNDETRAAIRVVQNQEAIRETGTLNRITLERLGIKLTEKQMLIPVTEISMTPGGAKPTKEKKEKADKTKTDRIGDNTDKPKRGPIFKANKDQISAAQRILKNSAMYDGPETGKMDKPTRDALKKYQEANGLKATGGLNKDTLVKMGIELTDRQKDM
jgi:peptidoglycan hydrolase-like protein with peptidoglycan-binding domain